MTTTDMQEMQKIIVLDYGSQYNQLITRRIREFGVFKEDPILDRLEADSKRIREMARSRV